MQTKQTPVMTKFAEWRAQLEGPCSDPAMSDDEADARADRLSVLEAEVIALPAQDMRDVAAKVLVYSVNGESALDDCQPLLHELRSLVGMAAE